MISHNLQNITRVFLIMLSLFFVLIKARSPSKGGLLLPKHMTSGWQGTLASLDFSQLILYQDEHVLVTYKPATILAQGDKTGSENMLDAAQAYIGINYDLKLVHRLDRPASGVLAFALTQEAAAGLSKAFKNREVDKRYIAMVNGNLPVVEAGKKYDLRNLMDERGTISKVLPWDPSKASTISSVTPYREARMEYEPLHSIELTRKGETTHQSLVGITLSTGRKHQIRAQMGALGYSVVGDKRYGADQAFKSRDISLHAASLSFKHPVDSSKKVAVCAAVPVSWESRFGNRVCEIATSQAFHVTTGS